MLNGKRITAVLLAAGSSSRMGRNKMLLQFSGKTPIELCIEAFMGIADEIVIAVSEHTGTAANAAVSKVMEAQGTEIKKSNVPIIITLGGETRQQSVFEAVKLSSGDIVSVHDCARCLVDKETIKRSIMGAVEHGCGIASVRVVDTIRNEKTGEIVDRTELLAAQTPQSFERLSLTAAYEDVEGEYTDDAALFRAAGNKLHYTLGNSINRKLTTEDDLELFEAIAGRRIE